MILYLLERLWIELKQALATGTVTADNACVLQNSQVLGDGLAREMGVVRELRDRLALPATELREQRKTGGIAECGEAAGRTFSHPVCGQGWGTRHL